MLLSSLLLNIVIRIIVIIMIVMMMITCMRSMVGRAGEGEEEQAVVRVPRLVKDCVSRHARLVMMMMMMMMMMMVRVTKPVKDFVDERKYLQIFCFTVEITSHLLRFSSRSPGRSVSTSTSLSGSSACFLVVT